MNKNLEQYQKKLTDLIDRFRDVRFTGQVVFVAIVLLISWSGVKTIQTNYALQRQISEIKQQNAVQELQNNNLALQNQYYNSKEYLDLSARRNFGLGAPGEKELLVPQSVAYTYAPEISASLTAAKTKDSGHTSNFQSWVNFFLHRPQQ